MKTNLKYIIAFLIFCIIAFAGYKFFSKQKNATSNLIPNIQLQSIEDKLVSLRTDSNKFHFLIFFDSKCEHCQAEATLLQKHLSDFKNAEITFISMEKMRNIKIFAADYQFKNIPNITFCQIEPEVLSKEFGNMGFPTIFIYNPQNQLVDKLSGQVKIEDLAKYLK
ncbi:MAG: redoxin domain-containing protein [Bacteroidota bacterium]